MEVKFYGTRGSVPVCRPDSMKHGGNTTCLRIISDRIPAGYALVVDAGSGFFPLSKDLLLEKIFDIAMIMTHYHWDHVQGLPLAPHSHLDNPPTPFRCTYRVWGPAEHGRGPIEAFARQFEGPEFPVPFQRIAHRFSFKPMDPIGTHTLIVHPQGGFRLLALHTFRSLQEEKKQITFDNGHRYEIDECLVVFMRKTAHPEYTVSYRFEERSTGKVFVFLTDHENSEGLARDLIEHVRGADLLVQDAQYSEAAYHERYVGFGHGTPEYCALLACEAGVKRLGLTHHDPGASDQEVEFRLSEAKRRANELKNPALAEKIFACADYQKLTV